MTDDWIARLQADRDYGVRRLAELEAAMDEMTRRVVARAAACKPEEMPAPRPAPVRPPLPSEIPPQELPPYFWWNRPEVGATYWMSRTNPVIHEERGCKPLRTSRPDLREAVTVVVSTLECTDGWYWRWGAWSYWDWRSDLQVAFADGRRRSVQPCRWCCEPRAVEVFAFPAERVGAPVTRDAWMDGAALVPLR